MADFTNLMKDKTAYLSEEEVDKMLSYCWKEKRIRDYVLILTLYRTGRRITEIVGEKPFTRKVGLRPCDILDDNLIEFDILKKDPIKSRSTKTGKKLDPSIVNEKRIRKMPKRRLKPVDTEYYNILKWFIDYNGIHSQSRIFPITQQRVDYIIKEIAKKCNISRPNGKKIHAHNFRHSYAIHLLKKNPNDPSVLIKAKELLDHSSLEVTMTYTQFTQMDKLDILERSFNHD